MAFGFTYTLPTITGSHTNFAVIFKTADFPSEAIDGTANALDNGGGNLRAYTDDGKGTQLSVEVLTFVSSGSPNANVRVKVTAATGNTIYIEADDVETSQPAVGAAFGRNSVWPNYLIVSHIDIDGTTSAGAYINSTGGTDGTGVSMSLSTVAGPMDNQAGDFDGTADYVNFPVSLELTDDVFTVSIWGKCDSLSEDQRVGGFFNTGDTENSVSIIWMDAGGTGDGWRAQTKDASGTVSTVGLDADNNASTNWQMLQQRYGTTTQVLRVDGTETANESASGNFTSGLEEANEFRLGRIWDSSGSSSYFNGGLSTLKVAMTEFSDDYLDTEEANESSVTSWGTVGSWADSAGGITIPVIMNQLRNQGIS